MMELTSTISESELNSIAAKINDHEAQINALMGRSLHLAALIGADLIRVKKSLAPGEFMDWIKNHCKLKQHQCNRYMRLAKNNPEYLDPDRCPEISINVALELIAATDDVRELVNEAIASGEVVHQKTIRELSGKSSYPGVRGVVTPAVVRSIDTVPRTETWIFVPHVCQICCGRLLMRRVSPKITEFICAKCENRGRGEVENFCWCGKEAGPYGQIFECIPNPNKRAELPNAIMVREKPKVMKPMERRPSRYVSTGNVFDSL
jgi:hypothetical protein